MPPRSGSKTKRIEAILGREPLASIGQDIERVSDTITAEKEREIALSAELQKKASDFQALSQRLDALVAAAGPGALTAEPTPGLQFLVRQLTAKKSALEKEREALVLLQPWSFPDSVPWHKRYSELPPAQFLADTLAIYKSPFLDDSVKSLIRSLVGDPKMRPMRQHMLHSAGLVIYSEDSSDQAIQDSLIYRYPGYIAGIGPTQSFWNDIQLKAALNIDHTDIEQHFDENRRYVIFGDAYTVQTHRLISVAHLNEVNFSLGSTYDYGTFIDSETDPASLKRELYEKTMRDMIHALVLAAQECHIDTLVVPSIGMNKLTDAAKQVPDEDEEFHAKVLWRSLRDAAQRVPNLKIKYIWSDLSKLKAEWFQGWRTTHAAAIPANLWIADPVDTLFSSLPEDRYGKVMLTNLCEPGAWLGNGGLSDWPTVDAMVVAGNNAEKMGEWLNSSYLHNATFNPPLFDRSHWFRVGDE